MNFKRVLMCLFKVLQITILREVSNLCVALMQICLRMYAHIRKYPVTNYKFSISISFFQLSLIDG